MQHSNLIFISLSVAMLLFWGSCKDKMQEQLLVESRIRLEQQNDRTQSDNQRLHNSFDALMDNDGELTNERYTYLKKYALNFYQSSNSFSEEIISAQKSGNRIDRNRLFQQYTAFQISYRQLNNRITDSFKYMRLDSNINTFMKLDEKNFTQKYLSTTDSINLQIQLQLLKADALLNEYTFLEKAISYMAVEDPHFDSYRAIATSNKCVYKKGDRLEVNACMAKYAPNLKGSAIIDGQKIEPKYGEFIYSRIVTEAPGVYNVPIIIIMNKDGRQVDYPARLYFKVE